MMQINIEHPFFRESKQVISLCQPLFTHTPISLFRYGRYQYDGYCVSISTHPELDCEVLNLNLLPSLDELALNKAHLVFLTSALQLPDGVIHDETFLKNFEIHKFYCIHHRIVLIFNNATHVETFEFGIGDYEKNFIELFMNNVKSLESFCLYFRESSKVLISNAEEGKYQFDFTASLKGSVNDRAFNNEFKDFLKNIKLNKHTINGKKSSQILSTREFECLAWLTRGRTAKEIGRLLSLSPRTVESYLVNIKNKLDCNSKEELINIGKVNKIIQQAHAFGFFEQEFELI